jgi:quercetin dioxygenase-like cupin family protein
MKKRRDLLKTLMLSPAVAAAQAPNPARIVHRQPLGPPLENMEATFVEVTVPAGPGSRPHRHSGFVLGYVLDGEFRFGTNEQPERVLKAGEAFYEPVGAVHTTSASAHPTRPARILAIVVGEKGKPITTVDK